MLMSSTGSMKVVLPLADSSYTKPPIFLLCEEMTGMSIFPSRTVTLASLSAMPSCWALRSRDAAIFETELSFSLRERRIS